VGGEDEGDHQGRDDQRWQVRLRQVRRHLPQLLEGVRRVHRDAQHTAEHGDADLKADTRQKPDQHRPGQKIGQETELEDARQEQERGREQGHHFDQVHVVGGLRPGHVRQPTGEDGGGRGVRRHHQVARRAEDREGDQGRKTV
jgi:hypothetical protein